MGINHKRRGKVTFSQRVGVVGIGAGTPCRQGSRAKSPEGGESQCLKYAGVGPGTGEEKSRGESGQVE